MDRNLDAQKAGWMAGYADSIASHLTHRAGFTDVPWDDVRDICDQRTGGDLDAFRLDLLTDMVCERLKRAA